MLSRHANIFKPKIAILRSYIYFKKNQKNFHFQRPWRAQSFSITGIEMDDSANQIRVFATEYPVNVF